MEWNRILAKLTDFIVFLHLQIIKRMKQPIITDINQLGSNGSYTYEGKVQVGIFPELYVDLGEVFE